MQIAARLSCYQEQFKDRAIETIKQQGFEYIALHGGEELKNIKINGFKSIIHAAYNDLNIASRNEGIRKESIKQIKEDIKLAKELNCKYLTVHPGRCINIHHIDEAYEDLALSLTELISFAKQYNVTICLEYMDEEFRNVCTTAENFKFLFNKFPQLEMTLDLAHVIFNKQDPIELLTQFKDRIHVIHISGLYQRKSHVEVSLKESEYDFTQIIQLLKDKDIILDIEQREYSKWEESYNFVKQI